MYLYAEVYFDGFCLLSMNTIEQVTPVVEGDQGRSSDLGCLGNIATEISILIFH